MDYRIEKLSAQNIHHLIPLYRVAFQQVVTLPYLLRKYNTTSLGIEFIGFIAFTPAGTTVGYYGVIPCMFNIDGQSVLAAQSADTMTHPDHRKKGLFKLLASQTYDLAREQNIQFIFGFPNQNSLSGFARLKWQFLPDQLQVFVLKTRGFPYGILVNRSPTLSKWYKKLLNNFLGTERISESSFEPKHTGMRHDDAFISYKTYNDTHIATIGTVKVWVKADGKLKIGLVNGLNAGNVEDFLKGLKQLASRLGCNEVIFITSKNSTLYQALQKTLKPKDGFPIGFYSLQERSFSFENVSFDYCDLDIF